MFVAFQLKNYSSNFDESFRDYSCRYQKSYKKIGLKITSENILIVRVGTTAVSRGKW